MKVDWHAHNPHVGQVLRQLSPCASAAAAFGAELRDRRVRARWSLSELGRQVFVSGALLGRIEKAERRPHPDLVRQLDEVFDASGELVRLASAFLEPERGFESEDLTPDTAEETLRTLIIDVRCHDHTMAAGQLQQVAHCIKAVEALAAKASVAQHAGLWRAVAEAQQLTAWISFDHGYRRQAETTLARARSNAEKANALDLVAYIGGPNSAFIHTWNGDPARGVELAYGALGWARRSGNRRLIAFVAAMAARAHAKLNEASLCREMLSLAETHLDQHQDEANDPDWLTVFDHTALAGHRGSCLLDLGNPHDAVEALTEQQSTGPATFVRNNLIWQLERSIADLQTGQVDAAMSAIERTLTYAAGTPVTPRVLQVFRSTDRALSVTADESTTAVTRGRLRGFIAANG